MGRMEDTTSRRPMNTRSRQLPNALVGSLMFCCQSEADGMTNENKPVTLVRDVVFGCYDGLHQTNISIFQSNFIPLSCVRMSRS